MEKEKTVPVVFPAVPSVVAEIDSEYIVAYCVANKQVKWLKEVASKTYLDKENKSRRYGFFQIRKEFVEKFMVELAEKKNKETLFKRIMALEE